MGRAGRLGVARQALLGAAVANAIKPAPGYWAGVPAFVAGWPVSELPGHLGAVHAVDVVRSLRRARRAGASGADRAAAVLSVANAAGLALLLVRGLAARGVLDRALDEAGVAPVAAAAAGTPATTRSRAQRAHDLLLPWHAAPDVRVVRDVRYSDAGRRGLLDLYLPAPGTAPPGGAPVLVQVHGGGWSLGDKEHQGLPLVRHLARHGWLCVVPNYRLAPRDPFPAQLVDTKQVVAWARQHAGEHGGDPSYVAITGGSAGGHLAALTALTAGLPQWQPGFEDEDTSVSASVPVYGVYDLAGVLGSPRGLMLRDRFWGPRVQRSRYPDDPRAFHDATPLDQVHADAPAFLVVHGRVDSVVPVEQARAFTDRLRAVSRRPVLYAELPGAHHAFDVFSSPRSLATVDAVHRFLVWHHREQSTSGGSE